MRENDGNVINFPKEGADQLPVQVVERILGGKTDVRIAIAKHPLTGELAPCVPIADYAEVFSYDREPIRRMTERTKWLKKYSCSVMMEDHLHRFQSNLCIFEEAMLGIFMKLQPQRCKDKEAGARIDQLQEEMILTLRDVLRGYATDHKAAYAYDERSGFLPRPGLSMDAIAGLCREADKYLKGKMSIRALNYFTGIPVDDLMEEIEHTAVVNSTLAGTILQYFDALREIDTERFGIRKGTNEEGNFYVDAETKALYTAFFFLQRDQKLPKFFTSVQNFGYLMGREAAALEYLGLKRSRLPIIRGRRSRRRYEYISQVAGNLSDE